MTNNERPTPSGAAGKEINQENEMVSWRKWLIISWLRLEDWAWGERDFPGKKGREMPGFSGEGAGMNDNEKTMIQFPGRTSDAGLRAWLSKDGNSKCQFLSLIYTSVTDAGVMALAKQCHQLQSLSLGGTSVTDVGAMALAKQCHQLQSLDLSNTLVTDAGLMVLTDHCPQLQHLYLSNTEVTDAGLVTLAKQCHRLQSFSFSDTRVTDAGLTALAEQCHRLQYLNLSNTAVTDAGLKALVDHCPQLLSLDLSNTLVTDGGLTVLADHCPQLRHLFLSGAAVSLPEKLKNSGSENAQEILGFFRESQTKGGRPLPEVKVSILGLGRLGKSQLAKRLAPHNREERQTPYLRNASSTHAFEQRTAKRAHSRAGDWKSCLFRLFDFGGQPEMHGAHRFFLADKRNVYVVLVSVRRSRADNRLDYWLRMVKHHGGGAPVVVVVSHNDEQPAFNEDRFTPSAKPLEKLDADDLSKKHDIPVWMVGGYSNVTGENLDKVWEALENAVSGLHQVFDNRFPANFFKVHDWLGGKPGDKLKKQPPLKRYLSVKDFRAVCAAAGQTDAAQQNIWLALFRDLGLLHYVGDRPEVKRKHDHELAQIIFHPEWVKTPVYNVVRHSDADKRQGILPFGAICRAFGPEVPDEEDQRKIIALMEACELIFRVPGGKPDEADYLIVDQVPSRPAGRTSLDGWPAKPKKRLRWEFPFLPDHLLSQLLGRWFSKVPKDIGYFREDVVFEGRGENTCRVRLRSSVHEHAIDLEFDAGRDKDWERMLTQLEMEVESILDPERLRRECEDRLWQTIDLDAVPVVELTMEEERTLASLAEALCASHGVEDADGNSRLYTLFHAALHRGFMASLGMNPAPQLAYRACWVLACSQCVSNKRSPDEATPPEGESAEMEKVFEWLKDNDTIKKILLAGQKRKTLDKGDTLRGSYRNALESKQKSP